MSITTKPPNQQKISKNSWPFTISMKVILYKKTVPLLISFKY